MPEREQRRPSRLNPAVGGVPLFIFGAVLAIVGLKAPVIAFVVTGCIMATVGIVAVVVGLRNRSAR
jgi:hypothetical protein